MKTFLANIAVIFAAIFVQSQVVHAAENGFCDSYGQQSKYEWVQGVKINGELFSSENDGGYFEHFNPVTNLKPGKNTFEIEPGYSNYQYGNFWAAWLDLNGNGVFEESEQLFEHYGNAQTAIKFNLPSKLDATSSNLRLVMKHGSKPSPCGAYAFGETEDFKVYISEPDEPGLDYHLSVRPDFTLVRNGAVGDKAVWVIEVDGKVALKRNAASEIEYRYYRNYTGFHIRAWLEEFKDYQYQVVSNVVTYTPGTTNLYELNLNSHYAISRSGSIGDDLQWVIEKDGELVLERNAENELEYIYFANQEGGKYRVWLKSFIGGEYKVVSNTLEYEVGQSEFTISMDQQFKFFRNGQPGDPLEWIVEEDGVLISNVAADSGLTFEFEDRKPGAHYSVWLRRYEGQGYEQASNIVEFDMPSSYPYSLSLGDNYTVYRTGSYGDRLTWVIVKNGKVALQRNASNELSYRYFSNTYGSTIQVYLTQFIDGAYRPVSNTIEYTVR